MNCSAYQGFLDNNLATHVDDNYGEEYVDFLRYEVLAAGMDEIPHDAELCLRFYDICFRNRFYNKAQDAANRLYEITSDKIWIFNQLRCLVLLNDFISANELYQKHLEERGNPVINDWRAIQLMRDTVNSNFFLRMQENEYEKLFFIKPLLRKFGRHLKFLSYSLMDKFFYDLLAKAQDYVESKGARFYYISCSNLLTVKNKSDLELLFLNQSINSFNSKAEKNRVNWLKSNPDHMHQIHKDLPNYSSEYISQICSGPKNFIQTVKLVMSDWQSDFLNVKDGQRVTTEQPNDFDQNILIFGASDVFGYGTEDKNTFCSFLQRRINSNTSNNRLCVQNYGIRGCTLPFTVNNLLQTNVKDGDIVILYGFPQLSSENAASIGIESHHLDFSRPHSYGEIFIDQSHFAWSGHKVIADYIFDLLFTSTISSSKNKYLPSHNHIHNADKCIQFCKYLLYRRTYLSIEESSMCSYLSYLDQEKVPIEGLIGSVAVNCNPMTLGHLHLLEYAASRCDFLYVFVIEEDKSYFPFRERFKIVSEGLAHLDNVKVIKGGRYICTDITFPEYSTKGDNNNAIADASMEGWFFAEFIASKLNIQRIFLGEEPTCRITQQYNEQIKLILPKFDIHVDIIKRISLNGDIISASRVKALLKEQKFDLIRQIVPQATYDLLSSEYRIN